MSLILPIFGRATAQYTAHKHLFASLGDGTGVFAEYDLDDTQREGWQGNPPTRDLCTEDGDDGRQYKDSLQGPRLWSVLSSGKAIVRSITNDDELPLDPSKWGIGAPLPANATIGGTAYFKLVVSLSTVEGHKRFFMDVGEQIQFYGMGASVDVWGPENTLLVTPSNAQADSSRKGGLVVDSYVDVTFQAQEVSLDRTAVRFTSRAYVEAGTQAEIAVPPYAKSVRIYPDPTALPAGAWKRFIGDPSATGALPVGTLDFNAGASLQAHSPIGDETHLQTDLDAFSDRLFTLIWTIVP